MTSDKNLIPIPKQMEESIKLQDINQIIRDQRIEYYNEEESNEEDEDEEFDYDENEKPVCGCGALLSPGWNCVQCRYDCTTCHRAVILGDACSRCSTTTTTTTSTTTTI